MMKKQTTPKIEPARYIIELLILVNDQILTHGIDCTGLCSKIHHLAAHEEITTEERDILFKYIHKNIPLTWRTFMCGYFTSDRHHMNIFWWEAGEEKPRLKWLRKQINKCVN